MTEAQVAFLIKLGVIAITIIVIAVIWFVLWTVIFIPIAKKDDLLKERDEKRKELLEIQAAKSVEWDQYQDIVDQKERMQKSYFATKEKNEQGKEDFAKLTAEKEKLVAIIRNLRSEVKELTKSEKKTDD